MIAQLARPLIASARRRTHLESVHIIRTLKRQFHFGFLPSADHHLFRRIPPDVEMTHQCVHAVPETLGSRVCTRFHSSF